MQNECLKKYFHYFRLCESITNMCWQIELKKERNGNETWFLALNWDNSRVRANAHKWFVDRSLCSKISDVSNSIVHSNCADIKNVISKTTCQFESFFLYSGWTDGRTDGQVYEWIFSLDVVRSSGDLCRTLFILHWVFRSLTLNGESNEWLRLVLTETGICWFNYEGVQVCKTFKSFIIETFDSFSLIILENHKFSCIQEFDTINRCIVKIEIFKTIFIACTWWQPGNVDI